MINGLIHQVCFYQEADSLFERLLNSEAWDERMKSRKTMSYGRAYNYSQIVYPDQKMPPYLEDICEGIKTLLGYKPNNCLINLYPDGKAKMGYHSDQTSILAEQTGVSILSLGAARILRFRNKNEPEHMLDYQLESGSLLHMNQAMQKEWEHAVPKMNTEAPRISLTFRKLI